MFSILGLIALFIGLWMVISNMYGLFGGGSTSVFTKVTYGFGVAVGMFLIYKGTTMMLPGTSPTVPTQATSMTGGKRRYRR